MTDKELEITNGEIESPKEETHDVIPAADIKPEDLKDEDITDEMIDEFTKSEGKTLKLPKKAKKEEKDEKVSKKASEPDTVSKDKKAESASQGDEPKEEKKINYGAFYEQKQLRIAAEREITRLKAENEAIKTPPKQIPAYEEDPLENTNQRLAQIEQQRETDDQNAQAQQREQQFMNVYAQSAQQFAATEPTFQSAYNHLIDSRYRELTAYGFSPEEANKTITDEEKWMVGAALNKGQNPAAQLFALAKMRGFNATPPVPQPPVQGGTNTQKLESIERGQNLNKAVTGGKIAGQDLTEEVLSDIDSYNPFENIRGKTTLDVLFDNMRKGH